VPDFLWLLLQGHPCPHSTRACAIKAGIKLTQARQTERNPLCHNLLGEKYT